MTSQLSCAIHQPNLFPRLSTLAKIYTADIWIVLDDVQRNMRDYQHRTRLLSPDASHEQWLSLAVHRPFGRTTQINQASVLNPTKNARRVRGLIHQRYNRCRQWPALRQLVDAVAAEIRLGSSLLDVTELSTRLLLHHIGWHGQAVRSSTFTVGQERSERLADLTAAVGARQYNCGTGGARYLDETAFHQRHIAVQYVQLPNAAGLRQHRHVSGLWWLTAATWDDLRELFWNQATTSQPAI